MQTEATNMQTDSGNMLVNEQPNDHGHPGMGPLELDGQDMAGPQRNPGVNYSPRQLR